MPKDLDAHKCENIPWGKSVVYYENSRDGSWMLVFTDGSERIKYCPYCGVKL
jgi:hypothetical protein